MPLQTIGVIAGTVATALFVASYLPMLVKARRTRDLRSYSAGNLVIANIGNLVYTLYVLSLPPGPLWVLHGFYLLSTALMLYWWWRFRSGWAQEVPVGRAGSDGDASSGRERDDELGAVGRELSELRR